jgi:diacylglycerol kinase (ATP)
MFDFRKIVQSHRYAIEGIKYTFKYNQNIRFHFLIAILVIIASIFFRVSAFEMGILGVMILLVFCAEMINTAIEEMVNFLVNEHRKEAKIAKDVSAGMVLLTVIGSVIVGFLVFTPHIIRLLK